MPNAGTAALTVLIGVAVYVLGKIIERAFIEPLNDYRRLVMEIAGALAMHDDLWGNSAAWDALVRHSDAGGDEWFNELSRATGNASRNLRAKAAELEAYALTIPWYRLWHWLGFVPKRSNVLLASRKLKDISILTPAPQDEAAKANREDYRHIQRLLRMATK